MDRLSYDFPVQREALVNAAGKETGYDSIYRIDTGMNLGVVSQDYNLVTHKEAVDQVLEALAKKRFPKVEFVSEQTTHNGAHMFATFKVNRKFDIGQAVKSQNLKVGDYISPGFSVVNSYDRMIKYSMELFVYRLACLNGMIISEELFHYSKRHTNSLDIGAMVEKLEAAYESFESKIVPQIAGLGDALVTPPSLERELNLVPGWVQDESMEYLEKADFIRFLEEEDGPTIEMHSMMSRWDLMNAFTYVLTHSESATPERKLEINQEISDRFWSN